MTRDESCEDRFGNVEAGEGDTCEARPAVWSAEERVGDGAVGGDADV